MQKNHLHPGYAYNDNYRWSARRVRCPYRDRVDQLNHRQPPPLPSPLCKHYVKLLRHPVIFAHMICIHYVTQESFETGISLVKVLPYRLGAGKKSGLTFAPIQGYQIFHFNHSHPG